ncbi:sulfatase family protein [Paenibacillus sp. strain BS8-2]
MTQQRKKPNLLFVFADQWRRQAVGVRDEDPVITPNFDRFARESADFDQAVSCYPLCSPNRSSLLTGRFPLSTGVTTNCKTGLSIQLNDGEIGFGEALKAEGYSTGYIGKWHLDEPDLNKSANPTSGASNWDAYTPPGPRRLGFDFWYSYGADGQHLHPHYWKDTPEMIRIDEWSPKHETDVAEAYIRDRDRDRPFALFLSWNPPHHPYDQVPAEYRERYAGMELPTRPNVIGEGVEEAEKHSLNYFAAVTGIDDQFGRLMATLEEEGLTDDTIVVVTSDHGDTLGSHAWKQNKNIWYEESIGVPLFIRWPGNIRPGTNSTLVNSVDLMPTLLGLMNAEIPALVQGENLANAVAESEYQERGSVFICRYPGSVAEYEEAKRRGIDLLAYGWRGVRTSRYTYVVTRSHIEDSRERILYDNEKDPYQLQPITNYEGYVDLMSVLESELEGWLKKIGDPFPIRVGSVQ